MKQHGTITVISLFILLSAPSALNAESGIGFLASGTQLGFSTGGGAQLPNSVLQMLLAKKVSPEMSFLLLHNVMNSCISDVIAKYVPGEKDGYRLASTKYAVGICQLFSCMEQAVMLGYAASADSQGGSEAAATMAEALSKKTCNNVTQIDPRLLEVLLRAAR